MLFTWCLVRFLNYAWFSEANGLVEEHWLQRFNHINIISDILLWYYFKKRIIVSHNIFINKQTYFYKAISHQCFNNFIYILICLFINVFCLAQTIKVTYHKNLTCSFKRYYTRRALYLQASRKDQLFINDRKYKFQFDYLEFLISINTKCLFTKSN